MILKIFITAVVVGSAVGSYKGSHQDESHGPAQPYAFGYEVKDHEGAQHRQEESDGSGTVKGSYGYKDANGIYREVHYVADKDGFRAQVKTNEPGTANQDPADVDVKADVSQHKHEFKQHANHHEFGDLGTKHHGLNDHDIKLSGFKGSDIKHHDFKDLGTKHHGFNDHDIKLSGFKGSDIKHHDFKDLGSKHHGFNDHDIKLSAFKGSDIKHHEFKDLGIKHHGFNDHDIKLSGLKGDNDFKGLDINHHGFADLGINHHDFNDLGIKHHDIQDLGIKHHDIEDLGMKHHDFKDLGIKHHQFKVPAIKYSQKGLSGKAPQVTQFFKMHGINHPQINKYVQHTDVKKSVPEFNFDDLKVDIPKPVGLAHHSYQQSSHKGHRQPLKLSSYNYPPTSFYKGMHNFSPLHRYSYKSFLPLSQGKDINSYDLGNYGNFDSFHKTVNMNFDHTDFNA